MLNIALCPVPEDLAIILLFYFLGRNKMGRSKE
jgi:hypothetical protein